MLFNVTKSIFYSFSLQINIIFLNQNYVKLFFSKNSYNFGKGKKHDSWDWLKVDFSRKSKIIFYNIK